MLVLVPEAVTLVTYLDLSGTMEGIIPTSVAAVYTQVAFDTKRVITFQLQKLFY